ncbi:hypothetical protein K493DRAFT_303751 [Basidiobolus meristosporus CBS 931.73]|uniref:Extracellular membrane protein CFEM domain-containing protein n=1 Tax=Basidiobolus meristosporus CBS 931.73 TaxID=1314790 RepID=A0A1Y1Y1L3_9FUNG|nr:hypothetical protein K493DRAFT_303751 [Basidiobolus meristosporus CBS 931.73]|eukprot:ORX91839.1 hypothetical protein K493DRAFT_303751 [Basidiobolus meristosporus CBS 931.73]
MLSFTSILIILVTLSQGVLSVRVDGEPSNSTAPAPIDLPEILEEDARYECTQLYRCGDDQACIAECYGVPSPDIDQVLATLDCFAQCQSSSSSIASCQAECLSNHYQPSTQHHPVSIQPSPPSPTGAVDSKPPPGQPGGGITRKRAENSSPTLPVIGLSLLAPIAITRFLHQ